MSTNGSGPLLELDGVTAAYGRTVVVRDVSLSVPRTGIVALLGANGAGKTTLLRLCAGLLRARRGQVRVNGTDMTAATPTQRARAGLCLIPEGRGIFPSLTVAENLILLRPPWVRDERLDEGVSAFPVLRDRLKQTAGSLSGGEQQMLALARIYLARPKLALLDEVSMGLAPRIVDQIFEQLLLMAHNGIALLLVEQYVNRALEMADYVYLLNRGSMAFAGAPAELDERTVMARYLGKDLID
jgi:branched-chain amino acid transport system ATP-binding protein